MKTTTIEKEKKEIDLINKTKKGDKLAFEEIIINYESLIYNYILRMVNNTEIACDITQETFIGAYKNINYFDSNYKFSTWIYKIAKNKVIDETRKKSYQTSRHAISIDEPHINITSKDNTEEDVEYLSLKETLATEIDKLTPKLKSIIILCDIHEMTYREVSEIEKINIGTVKSRLNRARNQLKKSKSLRTFL